MKKLTLSFIISLVCLFGFSQNVEITLYQNSLKMRNDTLYFTYKIENKSDSIIVLYEIESVSVKLTDEDIPQEKYYDIARPRFLAKITGENNEYPSTILRSIMRDHFPPDTLPPSPQHPSVSPIKYIVLQPHQNVEHDNILILNSMELFNDPLFEPKEGIPYTFLSNEIYKFQLEYFSGPAFRKRFNKDKQWDSRLKNSIMFEGIVKSNVCTFSYPENFTPLETDQTDEAVLKEAENEKSIVDFQNFKWVKYVGFAVVSVLLVILFYKLIKRRL